MAETTSIPVSYTHLEARYEEIIQGLGIKLSLAAEFDKIAEMFVNKAGSEYAASRGEYLNGIVLAAYLGFEFIDAATVIFFQKDGSLNAEKTDKKLHDLSLIHI